jgi:hypothetical protein
MPILKFLILPDHGLKPCSTALQATMVTITPPMQSSNLTIHLITNVSRFLQVLSFPQSYMFIHGLSSQHAALKRVFE